MVATKTNIRTHYRIKFPDQELPFLPKIDQTASHRTKGYALSQFVHFDQKSSVPVPANYSITSSSKTLTLSIIIPAFNEESHLRDCLDSIRDQSVMPDEVIVVDNNSTDRTAIIADEYSFVRVVCEQRQGIVFARDAGFNASASDLIGRIDADTVLPADWVEKVLRMYTQAPQKEFAVAGSVYFYNIRMPRFNGWLVGKVSYLLGRTIFGFIFLQGCNMVMTRAQWQRVRGEVCHQTDIHEDLDLSIHLDRAQKGAIVYSDDIRAAILLRRAKHSPSSFWKHISMWPRTMRTHKFALWWMVVFGNALIFAIFRPLAMASKKISDVTVRTILALGRAS